MLEKRLDIDEMTLELCYPHQILAEYLRDFHLGEQNAITAQRLGRRGYGAAVTIRELVHDLREAGVPICSGHSGYYFATTMAELDKMIHSLRGRAESIMLAQSGLQKTFSKLSIEHDDECEDT